MTKTSAKLTCYIGSVVIAWHVPLTAQIATTRGGVRGGNAVVRVITPDTSHARIMSAEDFKQLDVESRRQIMMAWTAVDVVPAGRSESLLQLIDAGLTDADALVVRSALSVLQRIILTANFARVSGRPVGMDPSGRSATMNGLVGLLQHDDLAVRSAAIATIGGLDVSGSALEQALLATLADEPNAAIRSRILAALGGAARSGATSATSVLLSGLDDLSPQVRLGAVNGLRRLGGPEALRELLRRGPVETSAMVRNAIVASISGYGNELKPHRDAILRWLTNEHDPRIHAALTAIAERLA